MKLKVVKEDDKAITVIIDGTETILYKINTEKLKENFNDDLKKASKILSGNDVYRGLVLTNSILNDIPTINRYEEVATSVSELIKTLQNQLPYELTHIFHYLIKNISLEIYGKAQTFLQNVEVLNRYLRIIEVHMDELDCV